MKSNDMSARFLFNINSKLKKNAIENKEKCKQNVLKLINRVENNVFKTKNDR